MRMLTPIVGMHFRPPAKAIIANLPSGTPLLLEAEPDNQYDNNAVKISVLKSSLAALDAEIKPALEDSCAAMGTTPDELYSDEGAFQLGYVDAAKTGLAAKLAPIMHRFESATLEFNFQGKPVANVLLRDA